MNTVIKISGTSSRPFELSPGECGDAPWMSRPIVNMSRTSRSHRVSNQFCG